LTPPTRVGPSMRPSTRSPDCPASFIPQQKTSPLLSAQAWLSPATTGPAMATPGTVLGLSCMGGHIGRMGPLRIEPQQETLPSARVAQVWVLPAATCLTSLPTPGTGPGLSWVTVVPSPSCPLALRPQQLTLAWGRGGAG